MQTFNHLAISPDGECGAKIKQAGSRAADL